MLDKLNISKTFAGGRHAYHCYKRSPNMKGFAPAYQLAGRDAIGWFLPRPVQPNLDQMPMPFPKDYQSWIDGWELERSLDITQQEISNGCKTCTSDDAGGESS